MKHILVPTDLSDASQAAFIQARELAELYGDTRITLLAVIENIVPGSVQFEFGNALVDPEQAMTDLARATELMLKEYQEKYFSGLSVALDVVRAVHSVHAEINEYAAKHEIDLIVMATHGRSGIRHLMLGSVTEKLIRESTRPVLVVPSKKN